MNITGVLIYRLWVGGYTKVHKANIMQVAHYSDRQIGANLLYVSNTNSIDALFVI